MADKLTMTETVNASTNGRDSHTFEEGSTYERDVFPLTDELYNKFLMQKQAKKASAGAKVSSPGGVNNSGLQEGKDVAASDEHLATAAVIGVNTNRLDPATRWGINNGGYFPPPPLVGAAVAPDGSVASTENATFVEDTAVDDEQAKKAQSTRNAPDASTANKDKEGAGMQSSTNVPEKRSRPGPLEVK